MIVFCSPPATKRAGVYSNEPAKGQFRGIEQDAQSAEIAIGA
jgi:hypothetical protein